LTSSRWGVLIVNIGLNVLNLVVWFVCLWLVLRFQWSHALGLAILFWVAVSFLIMPMLFERVEQLGQSPPTPSAARARPVAHG
jgi:hypothetical protein